MPDDKLTLEKPIYKNDFLWKDPCPNDPGSVLLSDKIAYYAENFGLIFPFDRDRLRPAQYTLRVGGIGYCAGKKIKITKKEPLIIPPNGLVYIKIHEYLNIPYYMIARYSLRVIQVYRGLILDNGLQVDPGFHGHINVPVYNFTNEDKKLEFCERILSVEFVKTTAFKPDPPIKAETEREWVGPDLRNGDGYPIKLFKEESDELYFQKDIAGYFQPNEKNESSVLELKKTVESYTKKVKRMKRWGLLGAIAIVISLVGYIYTTHDSFAQARIEAEKANSAVRLQQVEVEEDYKKTGLELTKLEKKRDELVGLIREFEKKLYDAKTGLKQSYNTIESQTTDINNQLDAITIFKNDHVNELENIISELEKIIKEIQAKKEGQAK
ncbi:hypothetical protein KAR91_28880 [Candidatus Pacearchaeota archaeon]|nr:hypothetical protein [Candidatus Pacearchaeota archaeon]